MKQNEIYAYVYDFVSHLTENQDIFPTIKRIIFFGSAVRGDFDKESDIDIFIEINDISKKRSIDLLIQKEVNKFEVQKGKMWALRGLDFPIKVLVGSLQEERWKDLRDDILGYAKVLYSSFDETPNALHHCFIITYDTSKMIQSRKMAFLRMLLGYTSIKGNKKYVSKGLLEKIQGKRLSTQTLLVYKDGLAEIKAVLKRYKIPYVIREAWIK